MELWLWNFEGYFGVEENAPRCFFIGLKSD